MMTYTEGLTLGSKEIPAATNSYAAGIIVVKGTFALMEREATYDCEFE